MDVSVTVVDRTVMVGSLVRKAAHERTRKSAFAAREAMRQLVPVKSGALHDSIDVVRYSANEYEVFAGDEMVDYAAAVEFGTYRMSARPYFTPGMEAGRKIMHMSTI